MNKDVLKDLQLQLVHLSAGILNPLQALKSFDFRLLKNPDIRVRKASVYSLFYILQSGSQLSKSNYGSKLDISAQDIAVIEAPLVIKGDIVYLVLNSIDFELQSFQQSVSNWVKLQNPQKKWDSYLYLYQEVGEESFTLLSVERHGEADFRTKVDQLPDPLASGRCFCKVGKYWKEKVKLNFLRIGGGEEDLPSCSESLSDLSDTDCCCSLERVPRKIQEVVPKSKTLNNCLEQQSFYLKLKGSTPAISNSLKSTVEVVLAQSKIEDLIKESGNNIRISVPQGINYLASPESKSRKFIIKRGNEIKHCKAHFSLSPRKIERPTLQNEKAKFQKVTEKSNQHLRKNGKLNTLKIKRIDQSLDLMKAKISIEKQNWTQNHSLVEKRRVPEKLTLSEIIQAQRTLRFKPN